MKTKSKKAKGRALQDWVRNNLVRIIKLKPDAVRSAIMGERGVDVKLLTPYARRRFPFRVECKNQEKFKALYSDFNQAQAHSAPGEPLLIIKMNRKKPLAVLDAELFIRIINDWTTRRN